ncbi:MULTISPECIES: hypothetical protein [unclassified Streptomyces]|uniref:hypothetical protein n=1 Tax=unclassified Streptomyces TaxID=2593676 RepID=UPI00088DC932|nr:MULTISPECIES: hypothetical protein [unclassified Streptomyces]PBC72289.1 hypothetical protein BX261_7373 [Streptomyces sp. 2321.6]SDR62295.1 hypothetical protein SAMN05216511_7330 [Streptomyces sp. KS_16]SEE51663.1 hypothetical protein SAMN05428940_7379 [Streptomyces sp. 2133.1]SNC77793.1 hypothetical protein SAMN06272741_7209 [Streptomyces sp. 2114.4]
MTDTSPVENLSSAAEQIRAFNHASRHASDEWTFPSHSYGALGNLTHLAQMLGQAIDQATRPAMRTYEQGRLLIDGQGDPDAAIVQMLAASEDAVQHAQELAAALGRMHSATSAMGVDTKGLPGLAED